MPVRLIINADDFGLTPGINRAIIELFQAGALRSTSLIATASFTEEAVELMRQHPRLGVGCHLTFVDGIPAAHPESIPTLLGADGKTFRPSMLDFTQAVLRGTVRAGDLARETQAQIQRLQRMGVDVTHIDTHKHAHAFPEVARTVLYIAERCGIFAVRRPFEPRWCSALAGASWTRRLPMRWVERFEPRFAGLAAIRSGQIMSTDGTLGIAATGTLDAARLRAMIEAALNRGGEHMWELCTHPGHVDYALERTATRLRATREVEYKALLAVVPDIVRSADGPALIHYGELGVAGLQRASGQFQPYTGFEKVL